MREGSTILVWDISIRLFHWSLVIAFVVAYITGEVEGAVHVYFGYIILGLLAYRLIWGLIGTKYARFSSFLFGPGETIGYLTSTLSGQPKRYLGHNPAGSVMIFLLLFFLFVASMSGLVLYAQEGKGLLAMNPVTVISIANANGEDDEHEEDNNHDEFLEELHEYTSHVSLFLIALHVLGVYISSKLQKENLLRAMITGRKNAEEE